MARSKKQSTRVRQPRAPAEPPVGISVLLGLESAAPRPILPMARSTKAWVDKLRTYDPSRLDELEAKVTIGDSTWDELRAADEAYRGRHTNGELPGPPHQTTVLERLVYVDPRGWDVQLEEETRGADRQAAYQLMDMDRSELSRVVNAVSDEIVATRAASAQSFNRPTSQFRERLEVKAAQSRKRTEDKLLDNLMRPTRQVDTTRPPRWLRDIRDTQPTFYAWATSTHKMLTANGVDPKKAWDAAHTDYVDAQIERAEDEATATAHDPDDTVITDMADLELEPDDACIETVDDIEMATVNDLMDPSIDHGLVGDPSVLAAILIEHGVSMTSTGLPLYIKAARTGPHKPDRQAIADYLLGSAIDGVSTVVLDIDWIRKWTRESPNDLIQAEGITVATSTPARISLSALDRLGTKSRNWKSSILCRTDDGHYFKLFEAIKEASARCGKLLSLVCPPQSNPGPAHQPAPESRSRQKKKGRPISNIAHMSISYIPRMPLPPQHEGPQLPHQPEQTHQPAMGNPPQMLSEQLGPPPQMLSEQLGPPPQMLSEQLGPPPQMLSEQLGPPPQMLSEQLGPHPQMLSEQLGRPQMLSEQLGPHPQMLSEQLGPHPQMLSEQLGPHPQMLSEQLGPPQMLSEQLGPPQMLSEQLGPHPQMLSEQLGPPQMLSEQLGFIPPTGQQNHIEKQNMTQKHKCTSKKWYYDDEKQIWQKWYYNKERQVWQASVKDKIKERARKRDLRKRRKLNTAL
jgi:hypothetical protein